MGRTKLTMKEKTRVLTLLEQVEPVIHVAADLNVSKVSVYKLKKAAAVFPEGMVPQRKPGSGAQGDFP